VLSALRFPNKKESATLNQTAKKINLKKKKTAKKNYLLKMHFFFIKKYIS
jgi:hypothetical protein